MDTSLCTQPHMPTIIMNSFEKYKVFEQIQGTLLFYLLSNFFFLLKMLEWWWGFYTFFGTPLCRWLNGIELTRTFGITI